MKRFLMIALAAVAMLAATDVIAVPQDWPRQLNFGVIPTDSSANITDRFDNLGKYLEKRLGVKIVLKTATDYAAVITGMQFKHIDVAYFGPKSYVEAAARAGAECFVLEIAQDGSSGYHSLMIVRKDSPYRNIQDLKGKIWAFVDPNSTSGRLVPLVHFLQDLHIDPDSFFAKVIYSGGHEASMLAVKNGKVDAAATNDLDMARGNGKEWNQDKDFTVLWKSPLIPGSPIAYRKDLPVSLKKALQEALLSYNDPEGLNKLKLKGYMAVTDDMYKPVRDMMALTKQLQK